MDAKDNRRKRRIRTHIVITVAISVLCASFFINFSLLNGLNKVNKTIEEKFSELTRKIEKIESDKIIGENQRFTNQTLDIQQNSNETLNVCHMSAAQNAGNNTKDAKIANKPYPIPTEETELHKSIEKVKMSVIRTLKKELVGHLRGTKMFRRPKREFVIDLNEEALLSLAEFSTCTGGFSEDYFGPSSIRVEGCQDDDCVKTELMFTCSYEYLEGRGPHYCYMETLHVIKSRRILFVVNQDRDAHTCIADIKIYNWG